MAHEPDPTGRDERVRVAEPDDLDAVAELTRARRAALAAWSPTWWAKAPGADEMHPLWLQHLFSIGAGRVVVDGNGSIIGCAVLNDQGGQLFVDDIAARKGDVDRAAEALIATRSIGRPALTCLPTADTEAISAFVCAGALGVSSYWVASTARNTASESEPGPHRPNDLTRPSHTFGGQAFDPGAPGALAFTTARGSMVGTPSTTAPPVYDPGGTVTVVDHVSGVDLLDTLRTGLAVASGRGDVLLTVVCDADDADLRAALEDSGFERTVEVFAFPHA